MNNKLQNWYLHIDLDAFFASVEQLDNPEYRGLPVIVGGRKDDKRGVVSTASYEARKFGVHSAMPIFQALRLCPNGIYVRGRMKRYAELSYEIMQIFYDFSPDVEQMSIDEAFVDLTGTEQLFGPPEETAFKIKALVKEKTGLTVSIGLATTKYLAKIASGYSKPDGFFFIKPGEEQNFMLSLPLKKVWGIGPKALERLKKSGINTTQDIYEKPLNLLDFLFGTTMATFLYNVVRGEEKDIFSKKPKSHSISAENTFPEDITDVYTAETELLELAHGVMFRLLKEEKFSRTVTVKIKYDDFTSVTIQKTFDSYIITLDAFYENIKALFEEKYQKGRGIRLLGVGFDKVESSDKPVQQSLFESKEDKKQAVEKAILNLNKKHPEIKIQKARLLKSIAVILIIMSQLSPFKIKNSMERIYAEDFFSETNIISDEIISYKPNENFPELERKETESEEEQDTGTIYNWNINDKNKVDFHISGHWQGGLLGSFNSIFNQDMSPFFDVPIPVFKQDVELYSLFTLNKKWYFEANFADNFSNNTLSLGYIGDSYFRSGKLSNRNITMPDTYSSETFGFGLSGGSNQAPGFSAHWQSPYDKWSGDFLIRYDMTLPKSAIFYGMNKVNDNIINPQNYLNSYNFTFPESSKKKLSEIKNIYIESKNGNFKDRYGKTYKKLSKSDYYYSESENILHLAPSFENNENDYKIPNILITFISPSSVDNIITETGNYSENSSFAGEIQLLFNQSEKKYNLDDFSYPLKNNIENNAALVIQNSEGFSPYILSNTYDCGINENVEISVISKNTKKINQDYIAEEENFSYTSPYEDFFDKKHIFVKINDKKNPNNRYPFVKTNPEIYLNISTEPDIVLQIRTYNPISKINIGQKASAGTINILKNGSYISDFIYDINTGDIILSEPIKNSDQIKITWEEEASNFAKGSLALGLGFQLNILPELKWDIALTAKKPISFDKSVPTSEDVKSSFIALSTGINFSKNNFTINDKAAFSVKKQNDSDKLLVSTQKNFSPMIFEQKSNSGNETKSDLFINGKILTQKNNFTKKNHKGEKDETIKGYKTPLQWDFTEKTDNDIKWAAVDLKLEGGKELKNCTQLQLLLYLDKDSEITANNCDIFLQFGIKAGSEILFDNKNIPIFNITNKIDFNKNTWQNITIQFSDKDRAFLVSNNDARIIIVEKKHNTSKGKLYIGPYTVISKSIFTKSDENIIINTTSVPSEKDTFSSVINWITTEDITNEKSIITAESHFSPADFNPYKTINIKFAYENRSSKKLNNNVQNSPDLSITFDTDSNSFYSGNEIALKLDLFNITPYIENTKKYHKLSIKKDKTSPLAVYIDDVELNQSDYKIHINENIIPSRIKYEINTIIGNNVITNGSFYIDNVTYEKSDYIYTFENKINADYIKNNILTINDSPIISNGFIKAKSSQKFSDKKTSVLSYLNTGITITGISLQTDILLNKTNIQNAGHNIKTSYPFFNIFSFDESYRWNNLDKSLKKSNNFSLCLDYFNIPISINSTILGEENIIQKEQNHNTTISSNFYIKNNKISLSSSFITNQKINMLKNDYNHYDITNNYFQSWFDITKFQFSTGNTNASNRNTALENLFILNINNDFFTPSIEYNLSSEYENIKTPIYSDKTTLNISLPITLKNHFINFSLSKTGGDILTAQEKDYSNVTNKTDAYFSDLKYLFNQQSKRGWFYTSVPFYELFDQNISSKINGTYSAKYEIKYNKTLFNSFKDLYIPSSASLAVIRDIKSKGIFSDTYQIKTTVTNISLNNFGKNSKNQLFHFFNQEELITSLTCIAKIPVDQPQNTSYQISAYIQLLLMINNSSILNSRFDFSIDTNSNWNTKGMILYTRPGKTCLISAVASFFSEKFKKLKLDIIRKDSFSFSIGEANKIGMQKYEYNHSVDMGFLEHFTITTGIGASFSYTEKSTNQLSLNYSLGGKLSF